MQSRSLAVKGVVLARKQGNRVTAQITKTGKTAMI